jgi:CubicO group peptidase (beta-lactamase class C family)
MGSIEIHGECDPRFAPLAAAFRANFEAGHDLGASLCVTWRGRDVVDLWGGWADPERTRPWTRDTIVYVASSTKLATALALLILVGRGLVDLDAPVARYWPPFAEGGKAHVTVRDVFTQQAGVPGLRPPATGELRFDWEATTARVAAEPHWFEGRRVVAYHALTFGYIAGELIRRVDGRRPRDVVRQELTDPLGADFQIGLADKSDIGRLARVTPLPLRELPQGVVEASLASFGPLLPPSWRTATIEDPGGNGFTNARALARISAVIAGRGEVDGMRLLPAELVDEMLREQAYGLDPMFGPMRLGLLVMLDHAWFPAPTPSCAHWGGGGGSLEVFDPSTGVSLGYAPNDFTVAGPHADPRHVVIFEALGEVLRGL